MLPKYISARPVSTVLRTDDASLKSDLIVWNQAALLITANHDTITPDKPMKSTVPNPRLREACADAGPPERNTMHYLRRTHIIKPKREHGEAAVRAIAAHADDSATHDYYDTVGVGDIDIQSYILSMERMT